MGTPEQASQAPHLTYDPSPEGGPPPILEFRPGEPGVCPVRLQVSDREALVFRTRDSATTALRSTDFGVAPLGDEHAVTGAVCQHEEGLLRIDPPVVSALRKAIRPLFSDRSIDKWRPALEQAADTIVGNMSTSAQPANLTEVFSDPLVAAASGITAGIPAEDWPRLRDSSDRTLALVESPDDLKDVHEAWSGLYEYSEGFIAKKEAAPDQTILSDTIAVFKEAGLSDKQLVHAFATVINGFPTPTAVIDASVLELLHRPDVVAACLETPGLWRLTIEEVLRHKAHFAAVLPRVALREVEGVQIPKGTIVIPSLLAAVNDPSHTEKPGVFDPTQTANRSLVFGTGPHVCPGAGLTRQWLRIGMQSLFTQRPELRLATDISEIKLQKGMLPLPESIPIRWNS